MNTINAKKLSNGIFKLMLILFGILFAQNVVNAQAPANSDFCAKEFEVCKFDGAKEVFYGANGTFIKKTIQGGSACSTQTFGGNDPVPGVVKSCYIVQKSLNGSLNGKWSGYTPEGQKAPYIWQTVQVGNNLWFEDARAGKTTKFTGKITNGVITDSNQKTGTLSDNNRKITWSDGVTWRWEAALNEGALSDLNGDWAGYNSNGTITLYVWRIDQSNNGDLQFLDVGAGTKTVFSGKYLSGAIYDSLGNKGTIEISEIKWANGIIWKKKAKAEPTKGPRLSYDSNPYQYDPYAKDKTNPYKWIGGYERTIYNPLDGGILLKYNFDSQGNSDGCSDGSKEDRERYREPCFAHDTNYDAPFKAMGLPDTAGKALADYLFYRDMRFIALRDDYNMEVPAFFYQGVVNFASIPPERGGSPDPNKIIEQGGAIAVKNSSAYSATLTVSWTDPNGIARSEAVASTNGYTMVIPLSVGATNIKAECKADLGTTIFTKKFSQPEVYAVTVKGTSLNPTVDGFKSDTGTSYEVAVQTADEYLAGTDANIYLRICGTTGCTAENRLNPEASGNAFERNSLDKITLKDREVGEVRTIEVRTDNQWDSSDWKPRSITVTKGSRTWKFIIDQWFKDKKTATFTESKMNADANYLVQIKTADESGAGTDSNIFLKICGTKGCTVEKVVNPEIKSNAFEQNKTDQFNWTTGDVGDITYIEVRSDLSYGPGAAWKLESVVIVKGKTFVCFANKWFESKDSVRLDVTEIRP